MEDFDSVIPKEFQRLTKPLLPEEIKKKDRSALVDSIDKAREAIKEKNLEYPILVIPQGADSAGTSFYVADEDSQLDDLFEKARKDALLGKVHLVSRKDLKLDPGKHPFFN